MKRRYCRAAPSVPVLIALVLDVATTAAAITAAKRVRGDDYGFRAAGQMEYLAAPGLREVRW